MNSLWQDVRYAARLLRRQPAYAAFVVFTLAVGIGAVTAVFSVVNGVLLRPLPYPEPDRLVAIWGRFLPESGFDFPQFPLSTPEMLDYRRSATTLADVAAFSFSAVTVGGGDREPARVAGPSVTPNLFDVLGVRPLLGRSFSSEEGLPDGPRAVILSHGFWQTYFGGDPTVLGRSLLLSGVATPVVGVMPPGFAYPNPDVALWTPYRIDPGNPGNRQGHDIVAIGRLAHGATLAAAEAELDTIMRQWQAEWPDIHTGHFLFLRPLLDDLVFQVRPILLLLLAATSLLLVIVCVNVASVVLARGESRVREMAIRSALGAGRRRLLRLALVESFMLAGVGGAAGVLVAYGGVELLLALDDGTLPRTASVTIDARVLGFAVAASALSALLFGLMPAARGARGDAQAILRHDARTASGGRERLIFRRLLVTVEVALSVVLIIGAGLMVRSLDRLLAVHPGFDPSRVLVASVSLPSSSYPDAPQVEHFYAELLARVGGLPGVAAASASTLVPMGNSLGVWDFDIDGRPEPPPGQPKWNAAFGVARPGYFETLGIRLERGRAFTAQDGPTAEPVVIVNETLAARFFPQEDPIGRRIRVAGGDPALPWMTIVGVVGDVRDQALATPPRPMYLAPHAQAPVSVRFLARSLTIVVRATGDPATIAAPLREIVRSLDPLLPVYSVQTLDAAVARSAAGPRFTTTLLGVFALVGLVLGLSGVYGVLAYTVARRASEIGIRRALGAPAERIVRLILAQGLLPVVVGLATGLVAAFGATRLLESLLFETSPVDPPTYVLVATGVLVASVLACAVPARRALKVNPIVALRLE